MVTLTKANLHQPLVYVNFVYVYGGGARSTVYLVRELRNITSVEVVDIFGQCKPYLDALRAIDVQPTILCPEWNRKTAIGGQSRFERTKNLLLTVPDMAQVVIRLRQAFNTLAPRGVWVDNEKSLFVTWLALAKEVPITYFVRGKLDQINPLCRLAWRRVNAVVGVSEDNLRFLRTTPYAAGRIHAIYSGIDIPQTIAKANVTPSLLTFRKDYGLHLVLPAVISNHLKGHEVAIHALARYRSQGGKAELWLCGDAPPEVSRDYYHFLERLASELGVRDEVHFLGWRDDVPAVMASADVVLLPSYTEGLPHSLLEAMALSKPVISTRVGGIPELVRDGVDGILLEVGDIDSLVGALHQLADADTRARMGAAGHQRVREHFSLEDYAQRFLSIADSSRQSSQAIQGLPLTSGKETGDISL